MENTWEPRSPLGTILAAIWRPATLGLACLIPALVGCQTVSHKNMAEKSLAAGPNSAKSEPVKNKTEFHREVTPDQQYNVHMELGRVYEAQKEHDAALAEYQKALDSCARHGLGSGVKGSGVKQAAVHRRMGGALDRLGRFAQAEAHYRTALKLSPDDAKVWNDSGYSYYMQGRWTDAERNLKTAAKLSPDENKIQTNLGLVLAAAGKTDEALAALSKAGGPAVGHANLGYLLAASGKTEEAREHYQKALDAQPNLAPARQALAALDAKPANGTQLAANTARTKPPQVASAAKPVADLAKPVVYAAKPVVPTTDTGLQRVTGPRVIPLSAPTPPSPQ